MNRQAPETENALQRNPLRGSVERKTVRISGTAVPDCLGALAGIDAGMLHVRSDRRIPETTHVVVGFDHIQLAGVITRCEPARGDWELTIALTSTGRREARLPASGKLNIGTVDGKETTSCQASVIDASPSGIGVRIPLRLGPGTRIYVEMESELVLGEVRHCRPTEDGHFVAGVMIVEVASDVRTRSRFGAIWDKVRWQLSGAPGGERHRR